MKRNATAQDWDCISTVYILYYIGLHIFYNILVHLPETLSQATLSIESTRHYSSMLTFRRLSLRGNLIRKYSGHRCILWNVVNFGII